MASSFEARSRIDRLQEQYRRNQNRLIELQNQMQRWTREQSAAMARELNAALAQQDQDYRAAFAKAVQSIEAAHTEEIERLRREYAALLREHNEIELRLNAEHDALARKLEELSRAQDRQERNGRARADAGLHTLLWACGQAETMPVEQFYPHKLDIYRRAAARCRDLINDALYSAAVSAAESGKLGVERLMCDTDRKLNEFRMLVEQYRTQYQAIRCVLDSKAVHQMCAPDGELLFELSDTELDYWSDGLYRTLLDELDAHRLLLAEIGTDGAAWLRHRCTEQDAAAFIREQTDKLKTLPELLRVCISFAFSAVDCYDHAFELRDTVQALLAEQDFVFDAPIRFGPVQADIPRTPGWDAVYREHLRNERCTEAGQLPDYREERRLIFIRQGAGKPDIIRLRLIPVRSEDTVSYTVLLEVEAEHRTVPLRCVAERLLESVHIRLDKKAPPAVLRVMNRTQAEQIAASHVLHAAAI